MRPSQSLLNLKAGRTTLRTFPSDFHQAMHCVRGIKQQESTSTVKTTHKSGESCNKKVAYSFSTGSKKEFYYKTTNNGCSETTHVHHASQAAKSCALKCCSFRLHRITFTDFCLQRQHSDNQVSQDALWSLHKNALNNKELFYRFHLSKMQCGAVISHDAIIKKTCIVNCTWLITVPTVVQQRGSQIIYKGQWNQQYGKSCLICFELDCRATIFFIT